ncbi:MAG: helix-turn-helix domain-containing protein [Thaumarchaeota archaeon]|nr:helix-turn-helix domain-containing protein [Nitrososphaerota archaeon]
MSMKIPQRSNRIHELFVIDGPPSSVDSIAKDIEDDTSVKDVDISKSNSGRVVGSLNCMCGIGKTITSSKSFAITAAGRADGAVELTVLGNNKAMKDLLNSLDKEGASVEIAGWTSRNGSSLLSVRQELVVKVALECGYFDFPKKTKLRELARNLGVAPASLVESLRSAEKKILSEYVSAHLNCSPVQGRHESR